MRTELDLRTGRTKEHPQGWAHSLTHSFLTHSLAFCSSSASPIVLRSVLDSHLLTHTVLPLRHLESFTLMPVYTPSLSLHSVTLSLPCSHPWSPQHISYVYSLTPHTQASSHFHVCSLPHSLPVLSQIHSHTDVHTDTASACTHTTDVAQVLCSQCFSTLTHFCGPTFLGTTSLPT